MLASYPKPLDRNGAMSRIVRNKLDLQNPPKLTRRQEAELAALSKMPDAQIDYSDIPPLGETFWKNAVPNPFCKPKRDFNERQSVLIRMAGS